MYDLQRQALRIFVAPTDIDKIELSADEKHVRLVSKKETVYEIETGVAVPAIAFVPIVEPKQPIYRYEAIPDAQDPRISNLELVDNAQGREVRRLVACNRVYPAVWLASGQAEVPVSREKTGHESVGVFRFDPTSDAWTELFWCPTVGESSYFFLQNLAFDPDRHIGVKTSRDFVTKVLDLRTGQTLYTIDNSVNYQSPYKNLWDTPIGYLSTGELILGLLVLAVLLLGVVLGFRCIWKSIIHTVRNWPLPSSQEAKDYGERP